MLPPAQHHDTPYRLLTTDGVRTIEAAGRQLPRGRPGRADACSRPRRCATSRTSCGPATSRSCGRSSTTPRPRTTTASSRSSCCGTRPSRPAACCRSCQDTGTAIVVGKKGQRVLTGGGDEAAIARGVFDTYQTSNLRYSQMAPLDMYREVNTGNNLPAQIEIYATDGDEYHFLFMAKGGGSANKSYLFQETKALLNPASLMQLLRREAAHARHRGVPAVPPRHRDRRHLRRVRAEGREARVGALPRRAADRGQRAGRRLPRHRGRAAGARARPAVRHRRAVRRQVLLPRRARDPAAAPRRVVPGRDRGVVLGRPSGARQDHARRRLPRGARARSGAVHARGHRRRSRRRGRADRPQPADERDPRHALEVPGQDAPLADRADGRRARHRAREAQGAARRRRGDARVPERPHGLLRGSGEDAGGLRVGLVRADDRRAAWTRTSTCSSRTAAAS